MNTGTDRRLFAEMIIILAVCVGGWMLLVEPKVNELSALEAEITEARSNPVLRNRATIEQMAARLGDVRRRVGEIEARNAFGGDSSTMYGQIMDLAEAHGVVMQRLDPGSDRRASGQQDAVHVATFNMRVEGLYEQVASFLDAIQHIDGFVRPVALALSPRGDDESPIVEAQFACQALSFNVPEALLAMVRTDAEANSHAND